MTLFDIKKKTILVTGGYGYFGQAISFGLSQYDANICVLGRSEKKFEDAFPNCPRNIEFFECDISITSSISEVMACIAAKYGSIDVLINNAYYARGGKPLSTSDEDWLYSIDGVLNSTYRCIREAVPYFLNQKYGNIINIASMYGMVSPDFSVYETAPESLSAPYYGASKAGVLQLTRYFAQYLGPDGIRVNSISPGPFPSLDTQKKQEFVKALADKTSLKRFGQPEELIGSIVFLSSQASSYITGQNIVIDGGWTIS